MSRTPKCTPLINGLEVCDRVKPFHKSVNLSDMYLSDVVSVNRYGGYFDKKFCVTVNNTDALGLLTHRQDHSRPFEDAVKSRRLPPTIVCVNPSQANMYLRAIGDQKKFGEFVEELGECNVSNIRQIANDAASMVHENPDMEKHQIIQNLNLTITGRCNSDVVNEVVTKVIEQ